MGDGIRVVVILIILLRQSRQLDCQLMDLLRYGFRVFTHAGFGVLLVVTPAQLPKRIVEGFFCFFVAVHHSWHPTISRIS